MTALGDRIAAAKRHPADLTYSEWVALLEDVEKELRERVEVLSKESATAELRDAVADVHERSGYTDVPVLVWLLGEAGVGLAAIPGEPS